MASNKYTIEDIVELSGFTRRTIRYYIQEGLLEPPSGRGRGGFYYDSHLAQLRKIWSLQEQGMRLIAIKKLLKSGDVEEIPCAREVWAKYLIAPGIEINVRRDLEEIDGKKIARIIKVTKSIMKEETYGV
ncbi:MAG: MerR family transcriptional regulator [Chloroflexi bacterium]|nr:MerR family transcriptional regulator [Chloroflexota bacterium]